MSTHQGAAEGPSGPAHTIAVLALDGVYPFELGIPNRVFGIRGSGYEVATCSVDGKRVRTDADFFVAVDHGPELLAEADTVIIPPYDLSLFDSELPSDLAAAVALIPSDTRLISICTGAFVLAAAGLLDGRRATTHWAFAARFARLFPAIEVDPGVLFIDDGDILTSAGAASGLDVCLHIVRSDHGADFANRIARICVVPPWREGGQAQFIDAPLPTTESSATSAARDWALENLHRPLTLADLAERAQMSRRTFARRFVDEVGQTPVRWLNQQRVARARVLLETTAMSVEQVADQVGFATGTSLRQHFHTAIGIAPLAYRRAFSGT